MSEIKSQEESLIRQMIQSSFDEEGSDLNIEDDILKKIVVQRDHSLELVKLRKRALMGFSISVLVLLVYLFQNFQWSLPDTSHPIIDNGLSLSGIYLATIVGVFTILLQAVLLFGRKIEVR